MIVEVPPHVRESAALLGAGVPYALKVVAGRLGEDPDMGRTSGLPGIFTVMVDGELFEDCPALAVGYLREPDRVEIRYVTPASFAERTERTEQAGQAGWAEQAGDGENARARGRSVDPVTAAVTVREIAEAWRRITCRLRDHAADSYAALRPGARPADLAALEDTLDVVIPVELCALWTLAAGDDGVDGRGCLPGNWVLMPLDVVVAVHRWKMEVQAREDVLAADRPDSERVLVWKRTWIPVAARSTADRTSGLYLDAATGHLGRWSLYGDDTDEVVDTLVTYLEETADMLDSPALATRDRPGLVGGTLVWHSRIDPTRDERWQPLTGA
ncbi:hypothetical protein [Streptomyces sp. NPDC047000]|uniref:hypothetical protein n=1 Tax=Streptomyces sp. NPDC047000 TaxID=3155474 RepID=UPI0033E1D307